MCLREPMANRREQSNAKTQHRREAMHGRWPIDARQFIVSAFKVGLIYRGARDLARATSSRGIVSGSIWPLARLETRFCE